jgi:hypothetical protein
VIGGKLNNPKPSKIIEAILIGKNINIVKNVPYLTN